MLAAPMSSTCLTRSAHSLISAVTIFIVCTICVSARRDVEARFPAMGLKV